MLGADAVRGARLDMGCASDSGSMKCHCTMYTAAGQRQASEVVVKDNASGVDARWYTLCVLCYNHVINKRLYTLACGLHHDNWAN